MTIGVEQFAIGISWAASGVGLALWLWSWFAEKNPLRRQRLLDCGLVLISSAILLRIVTQTKPLGVLDWTMAILSPLFIAAALWRLCRTACPPADGAR